MHKYFKAAIKIMIKVAGYSAMRGNKSLVILAARLICGLHLGQVDSFLDQQLFSIPHSLRWQEARAPKDPGVVEVEQS